MKKKILVIDDSSIIRQHIKKSLEMNNYEVVEAQDGFDGIEKLNSNLDIALLITDINMPRLDGLSFSIKVREDQRFNKIPIFMLTSESNADFKLKAKNHGVTAWFVKPYRVEIMLPAIEKFIGKSE